MLLYSVKTLYLTFILHVSIIHMMMSVNGLDYNAFIWTRMAIEEKVTVTYHALEEPGFCLSILRAVQIKMPSNAK